MDRARLLRNCSAKTRGMGGEKVNEKERKKERKRDRERAGERERTVFGQICSSYVIIPVISIKGRCSSMSSLKRSVKSNSGFV